MREDGCDNDDDDGGGDGKLVDTRRASRRPSGREARWGRETNSTDADDGGGEDDLTGRDWDGGERERQQRSRQNRETRDVSDDLPTPAA
jgi:hypothetical protein